MKRTEQRVTKELCDKIYKIVKSLTYYPAVFSNSEFEVKVTKIDKPLPTYNIRIYFGGLTEMIIILEESLNNYEVLKMKMLGFGDKRKLRMKRKILRNLKIK